MKNKQGEVNGMHLLLKRYKKIFRIPENLDYYSRPDYKDAERKFVKYMLKGSTVSEALGNLRV